MGGVRDGSEAIPGASHSEAATGEAATVLFNESQSRIVISSAPDNAEKVLSILQSENIPHHLLGRVGMKILRVRTAGSELSWSVADLYDDWFNSIGRAVETDKEPVRSL